MSLDTLLKLVAPPVAKSRVRQPSLFDLLESQRTGPWLMLYGSSFNGGSVMLHSILVPAKDVKKINADNITNWSGNPHSSWGCGLVWGGGRPARVEFSAPLSDIGAKNLANGQQLIFGRDFDGRAEDKRYFEIAQFLTHAHGLHWTPERRAWCRLDENGDIEDVIVWKEEEGRGGYGEGVSIEIKRDILEMHMSATKTVLVQMFDSTVVPENFQGWNAWTERAVRDTKRGLNYRTGISGAGSYFRGVQLIKPQRTAEEYGAYLRDLERRPKRYESFITQDWKNKRIAMVSCAPEAMASYFDKDSPLPFQTSPVFFNAAVLDKYKADPEKYSLEHRSITCRNSWHLQSYDVNQAGQVHTYIRYLGNLPYAEQVYWKSFNEAPKCGISKRAFATDFEGRWDMEPDSLIDLQGLVLALHEANVEWYKLKERELVKQLHYPLTSSPKVWVDTLGTLAKVVNEGLERKFFEQTAKKLGCAGDAKWGSIRWAREALEASGVDGDVVLEVIQPLQDLQNLRTKQDAHSSGEEAKKLRAALLRKHKSPRGHVEELCGKLVHSLGVLRDTFKTGRA